MPCGSHEETHCCAETLFLYSLLSRLLSCFSCANAWNARVRHSGSTAQHGAARGWAGHTRCESHPGALRLLRLEHDVAKFGWLAGGLARGLAVVHGRLFACGLVLLVLFRLLILVFFHSMPQSTTRGGAAATSGTWVEVWRLHFVQNGVTARRHPAAQDKNNKWRLDTRRTTEGEYKQRSAS